MATVYEALDLRTERVRALKLLQPSLVSNDVHRRRFTREATVTAKVASDHVVDILDAGIDEASGSPFLVMPLLAGRDLAAEIEVRGALDAPTVLSYLTQIARALDRAHEARIVHRDLKPANVFIAERDDGSTQVMVLDFGIAKLIDRVSTRATEAILGSPLYLAPEQVRYKKERVTERADIYALGQLAYTALVGEAYYSPEDEASDGVMGLLMEMAVGETEPASTRARARRSVELPEAFDGWFARATARDPSARFDSASEAVIAFAGVFDLPIPEFRNARPVTTTPSTEPQEIIADEERSEPPPAPMHRSWRTALGIAGGAVLVVAAFWTFGARSAAREEQPSATDSAGRAAPSSPSVDAQPLLSAAPPRMSAEPTQPTPTASASVSVEQSTAASATAPAKSGRSNPAASARQSAAAPTASVAPPAAGVYVPPVTER